MLSWSPSLTRRSFSDLLPTDASSEDRGSPFEPGFFGPPRSSRFGELALGAPESGHERLTAAGAHADRDLVLHTNGVEQVAVEVAACQHAARQDVRQPDGGRRP